MADNAAGGGNRLLYSIIGVLGGVVAVGSVVLFGGNLLNSDKTRPADPPPTAQRPAPDQVPAPAPVQPSAIAQPPVLSDADRNALAASIDRAIAAGDFTYADRLLADANRNFAGSSAWPPLQQKLARAQAERNAQLHQAEARRLIAEARRFAQVGDFSDAEALLQEAEKQAPGFAETGQARGDIASMRTERGQLYRERYQYQAAIDQALNAHRLWEAERLLADYSQRFNADDEYRARANRLAEMRAESAWQARLNQSRNMIGNARQAMDRGDFVEAERLLVLADQSAPGFPEVNQARADLSRRRVAAEQQQDGIRLILAAIDAAFQRRQYDDAERAIEDGRRRYGSYSGWADLQRRTASARQGNDQQASELRLQNARALELVAAARRSTAQGDFAAAERALAEANVVSTSMPEVAIARAELERAKADRARQGAEIRTVAASVDAALARQQYADAERLIASGAKSYPSYPGWVELSRRLAEDRRTTPGQTGNAPMPAPPAPAQALPAAPSRPAAVPPPAAAPPAAAPATTAAPVPPPPQATALPAGPARPMPPVSSPAAAPPATPATPATPAALPPVAAPPPAPLAATVPTATVPTANAQVPQLVAAAREAIKRSDFSAAEKAVADAERLDAKAAAEVRAELKAALDKSKAPRPAVAPPATPPASPPGAPPPPAPLAATVPTATVPTANVPTANAQVPQLVAAAREAIKRSDFSAAEKAVADAEKLDAKVAADVRAELKVALDKSTAPRPLAAPLPPPVANTPPAAPALTTPADNRAAAATSAPAPNPRLPQLVATARSATKRSDFAKAEQAVAEAEKIDAAATVVLEVRAELNAAVAANLVEEARGAIKRSDFTAAEKAVVEAEKLDAKAAAKAAPVVKVRAELKAARLTNFVEEARDAIKRSDFTAAEKAVAEAEKLDVKAASEVRAELKAAEGKSKDKRAPASRN